VTGDRDPHAPLPLGLVSRLEDDRLEVELAGDFDMAATFKVEPQLDRMLAEKDVRSLVLDLGAVRFIDSAGLGALISIRDRTRGLGIEMALANVSPPVQRILDATGMGPVFGD
jgi:anti-anti-sigma factor